MPLKRPRFGIKLFLVFDRIGYTIKFCVHCDRSAASHLIHDGWKLVGQKLHLPCWLNSSVKLNSYFCWRKLFTVVQSKRTVYPANGCASKWLWESVSGQVPSVGRDLQVSVCNTMASGPPPSLYCCMSADIFLGQSIKHVSEARQRWRSVSGDSRGGGKSWDYSSPLIDVALRSWGGGAWSTVWRCVMPWRAAPSVRCQRLTNGGGQRRPTSATGLFDN